MLNVVRALVALVGSFGVVMGAAFFVDPAAMGERFFLIPRTVQGLATLRADMTGFFGLAGVCALIGAWRQRRDILIVPLALFATAILGRAVSLAVDGALPTAYPPMVFEAAMIAVLLLARRTFAR